MNLKKRLVSRFIKTIKVPSNHQQLPKIDEPTPAKNEKESSTQDELSKSIKLASSRLEFKTASSSIVSETIDSVFEVISPLDTLVKKAKVRFNSSENVSKTTSEVFEESQNIDHNVTTPPENLKSIMKVTKDYYRMEQLR